MGILMDTSVVIPANQMFLFVALLSVFLLFGKQHLCILITFIFTFYWGFVLNMDVFVNRIGNTGAAMALYLISGFVIVLMIIISFFAGDK